jgi:hypothetical protein
MDLKESQKMAEAIKIIDRVRTMSIDFVGEDRPVSIDQGAVTRLAGVMEAEGKMPFTVENAKDLNQAETVLLELFASSINYCFWYGRYDFRPMLGDSYSMYDVVIDAVQNKFNGQIGPDFVNAILDRLIFDRYPLVEERTKHLLEVAIGTQEFIMFVLSNRDNDARIVLHELVRRYPGFASDMFLKRAFLFVIQLNRKLNYFKEIDEIPVPADYQVPKMLEYFGCLKYKESLTHKIVSHTMIPRYSIEEVSIRGGTVLVCDELAKLIGWTKSEIDAWLWLRRKECKKPFHLTVTTDY